MFFAKGEINMNNIYKVIWSKAKNCYVVASEIAKSHTKSASGSEKMGGYGKKALLALAAASAIFCGGFVNVGAADTVHVDESSTPAIAQEVYTKAAVDTALDKKADKDSVYTKADTYTKTEVDTELAKKADAANVYTKADTYTKTEVNTAVDKKADKDSVYTKAETYTKTEVNAELAKKADASNVFTKDQTFTKDQVNTKLADYAKTTDVNTALDTAKNELDGKITANTAKITANETAITNLNNKAATTDTTLTNLSGRMTTAESDIGTLKADMTTAKSDIGTLKADMTTAKSDIGTLKADVSTAKSDINSLKAKDTELSGKIDTETANRITSDTALDHKIDAEIANRITSDTALDQKIDTEIQDRKDAIKAINDRTGGIARNLEGTQTTIEGIVKVDNQGNVKDVKDLSAETITTTGDAAIGGALGVTGETTLDGALTAKGEATFKDKVSVEKDLTVNGKLNVGEIYLENNKLEATGKKHDSATSITADGISNLAKVTEHGHTTESQFTHNEKGTINYAKDGDSTDWTETRSDVTANGVSNQMKDSAGNRHTYSQTATESKEQLVNGDKSNFEKKTAEGNTISIKDKDAAGNPKSLTNKQTVDGEKTSVTNNESSSTINQGADQIRHNVTSADGKKSSIEVKADGITNTSKDGTITNDAKDIVNNATGDMTNNVGGNQTNKIDGNQANTIGGDQTTTVEGKVTETYKNGQETNVTGNQDIHVTENQTNKIDEDQVNTIGGNQTTNVTGDISNTAKNITNEATTKLTDKVGANTRVLDGEGITDTVGGSNLKSRVTQKKGSIETVVTDGTSFNHSRDIPVASTKTLTGYGKMNQLLDDLSSSTKTITDGTHKTSKVQTALDITNTAADGTITNDAKNIVNNAQDTITNTAGTKITDTAGDSTVTTENGKGTTFTKRGSMAYRDGGPTDTNISGNTITTGKVTMDYAEVMKDLGVGGNAKIDGKTTTGSLEVTGTSTLKGDVTMESNATVKKDLTVGGNATIGGDVTASSYKVGRNTYIDANGINANNQKITNVADGSISEGSKDAVNGGQLYGVKRDLEHQVDKVGANAAAMANLRPMEFDPSSKWNIAAAIGNYGSETAAAIGAFYRPNDNVMVNLSTAFGTGENMVGGGVSVRLGKGGNKLSREENNALKAQVDDLTARMDALLSVLNPNMSKDFPDVPENHWAYEAVSRLAGNDIVQGYPDGEFHGERTMTRYEMAEIIYNALSRGAEAEKELVEEFKPELQAMAASEKATAEKAEG